MKHWKILVVVMLVLSFGIFFAFDSNEEETDEVITISNTYEPVYSDWVVEEEPTEVERGKIARTKTVGDNVTRETMILPPLTSSAYTVTNTPCTCAENGEIRFSIHKGGQEFIFSVIVGMTGVHRYSDWFEDTEDPEREFRECAVCGKREYRKRQIMTTELL